jgi:hypothetical protein
LILRAIKGRAAADAAAAAADYLNIRGREEAN